MRPSVHLQDFFIFLNENAVPVNIAPHSPPPALATAHPLSVSLNLVALVADVSGVLQYVCFCDCLVALSALPSRSPHAVAEHSFPSRGREG